MNPQAPGRDGLLEALQALHREVDSVLDVVVDVMDPSLDRFFDAYEHAGRLLRDQSRDGDAASEAEVRPDSSTPK